MTAQNVQILLKSRPQGEASAEHFEVRTTEAPTPEPGEVLVEIKAISLDPAMRGWMNEGRSYIEPVGLGDVMRALCAGQIIASNAPSLQVGDYVTGSLGVQKYATAAAEELQKIDTSIAPLPTYLHVLGMTGMTAYFGMLDVGAIKPGDRVLVSGAAGAVGSVAAQIAKIKGCEVIGIAGGKEKCAYLTDTLGLDGAIDYRSESLSDGLSRTCPKGIDVFFDNVGGETLDAALTRLRRHARIVICGAISQYNNPQDIKGPKNYLSLLVNRARMEGMVVFDYRDRYGEAAREMAGWMQSGQLKHREHLVQGIESFPDHLMMLFRGQNFGKLILEP